MRAVRLMVRVLDRVMVGAGVGGGGGGLPGPGGGAGVESVRPMVTAGLVEGRMILLSPRPVILGVVRGV